MRVYLRGYDIDKIAYDVNGFQEKPTQDTNTIFGELNVNRTRYVFKNINLRSILGNKFYEKDTVNIKLVDVKAINENGNNVIDYTSSPHLRGSNIFIKGLQFLNGKNENLLTQFTNFNPNEELVFENVFFNNGNAIDNRHYYEFTRTNQGGTTVDFYRFSWNENNILATNSLTRYRITSTTITDLNNKIVKAGQAQTSGNLSLFSVLVLDSGDGTLPARVNQTNNTVTITVLPEINNWFHRRFTDDVCEDDNNNELTVYLPQHQFNIDLTLELRDILSDKLQPIVDPNNKVYPSLEFVLDIY